MRFLGVAALLLAASSRLGAMEPEPAAAPPPATPSAAAPPPTAPAPGPPDEAGGRPVQLDEVVVVPPPPVGPELPDRRATSTVTQDDLARRLPRSAPDALRFEPGVFVQQTAHSQGSAFLRGLTGQQTLLLFDGIRLNNSTYRQGPNQYFFTLDSQSIRAIEVLRGGASTLYGSDALGGVILALPIEADLFAYPGESFGFTPHLRLRAGTSDDERGGRLQLEAVWNARVGAMVGFGGRRVGQLTSGGVVRNPADGERPQVPRFESDGKTQQGTGFDELTFDGRVAFALSRRHTIKLASYGYLQFDAPRTDQCPAAFAPYNECLTYDEQFRTLVYGVYEGAFLRGAALRLRATLSWQRQHERRSLVRPLASVASMGRDDVDTLGATVTLKTADLALRPWLKLALQGGVDHYFDWVHSAAWIAFSDIGVTQKRSRGQYLDASTYLHGGVFVEAAFTLWDQLALRGGARLSWVAARAPGDGESGSAAVDRRFVPVVGNVGLEWRPLDRLALFANYDRSFRAPNLDDLTSRQQTGPGFQFENSGLQPETGDTFELGLRLTKPLRLELFGYYALLHDLMLKSPRQDSDCPADTPMCQASWNKLQLVNAPRPSAIWGVEAAVQAALPLGFEARATLNWTVGEGPNLNPRPADPDVPYAERIPLSRIPPLNGTVELLWRHPLGLTASADMRWATLQDRLALSDLSDARIPRGGTPGFVVFDARVSLRLDERLYAALVFENLGDTAYRYHGSSVNGPGRSLIVLFDFGPLWRGR